MSLPLSQRHLLSIFTIIAISIVLYLNTLKNDFVYDDHLIIVEQNLNNIWNLFKIDYFTLSGEASYRPFVTITYFFDYAIFELDPQGYHLTNILLHTFNGVSLYIFLILAIQPQIGGNYNRDSAFFITGPLAGSIFFITHPVLTEAINGISYREDVLASLFYLTAFNLYLVTKTAMTSNQVLRSAIFCLLSCLAYFFALLSKEMAITLPLAIYCYEWIYGTNKVRLRPPLFIFFIIGYTTIIVGYIYLRFIHFYNPLEVYAGLGWSLNERLSTLPLLLINYIKLSIFPVSLSGDYVVSSVKSFFSISFILPLVIIVFLSILSILLRKKAQETAFGIIFLFITLAPVSNIIPISNPFAERYLYLPSISYAIIGTRIYQILRNQNTKNRTKRLYALLFIIVLGMFSFTVLNRNEIWRNDFSLFHDTLKKMPKSGGAHNALGVFYYKHGRIEKAVEEFKTAIRLETNPLFHYNLSLAYRRQGQIEEATKQYQAAIWLDPTFLPVREY